MKALKRSNWCWCLVFLLAACSSSTPHTPSPEASDAPRLQVPYVDPASIGNVRLALVSRDFRGNIVLVNASNRKYLRPRKYLQNNRPEQLGDYTYHANILSYTRLTTVVILADRDMAQFMGLFKVINFYDYAEEFAPARYTDGTWPQGRECIIAEINDKHYRFLRPAHLVYPHQKGQKIKFTPRGKAFFTLKKNIIEALRAGRGLFQPMRRPYADRFIKTNLKYIKAHQYRGIQKAK